MSDSSHEIELPGLDGANPLAFLAALGILRCVAVSDEASAPRLAWDRRTLRPRLFTACLSLQDVITSCAQVIRSLFAGPYSNGGYPSPSLLLPTARFVGLAQLVSAGTSAPLDRLSGDILAAACCESVPIGEETSVSEMSFANGQSSLYLLGGVRPNKKGKLMSYRGLRDIAARSDLESLISDAACRWQMVPGFPSFRWCPTEFRPAAYQSEEVSIDSVPGANALAFIGLSFFPTVPTDSGSRTVGMQGEMGQRELLYPLWDRPLGENVARAAVAHAPAIAALPPAERSEVGVFMMLSARRFTHEKGVYFGNTESR